MHTAEPLKTELNRNSDSGLLTWRTLRLSGHLQKLLPGSGEDTIDDGVPFVSSGEEEDVLCKQKEHED